MPEKIPDQNLSNDHTDLSELNVLRSKGSSFTLLDIANSMPQGSKAQRNQLRALAMAQETAASALIPAPGSTPQEQQ